jgi:hypothetical protein
VKLNILTVIVADEESVSTPRNVAMHGSTFVK